MKERISPRLNEVDFTDAHIEFDFIGEINSPIGNSTNDDHLAFLNRLKHVIDGSFPGFRPVFDEWTDNLPRME